MIIPCAARAANRPSDNWAMRRLLFTFPSIVLPSRPHPPNARLSKRVATALITACVASFCTLASAQSLPPEVSAALARAKVPPEALAALVIDAAPALNDKPGSKGSALLSYRASASVNPASVMKLVTTYAALDLLGPAYAWNTAVYTDGSIANGTLNGNLIIQGKGDPKLVLERL